MKKYVNGKYIELTSEEITAMQKEARKAELAEKSRSLTEAEVSRMLITQQINTLTVDDNTALRMKTFYPEWKDLVGQTVEKAEYKFQYGDDLYKTIPANHTFQAAWIPGNGTESLYTRIDETHRGTADDPIPYDGNMVLENGKYYMQDYVIYLCNRDTVNPVHNALADLVGLYVEEI